VNLKRTFHSVPSPHGFTYTPEFLSIEEEHEFLALVPSMPFRSIVMRGEVALREVACFGFDYLYTARDVVPAESFPSLLLRLRERAETLAGDGSTLEQAIVTSYPAGAGINWHKDAPVFGPSIVGISVGSSARIHLRQESNVHRLILAPRSAYVLSGEARRAWLHRVSPVRGQRYSITFRSLALPA
jgi:alkylated DNA repair protein (DNA oxidative demethylase)